MSKFLFWAAILTIGACLFGFGVAVGEAIHGHDLMTIGETGIPVISAVAVVTVVAYVVAKFTYHAR